VIFCSASHSFEEVSGSVKTMNCFQRIIQAQSNLVEHVEISKLKLDGLDVMVACTTNIQQSLFSSREHAATSGSYL
jgi:hypothetical protein